MTIQRSTEIKVGLVSILAIILFIIGISLGKGCNVSVNPKIIKLRFPSSGNILISAPVHINGVKRGVVNTIKNDNGSVLITASVDEVDDFKKDVSAKITILEITGGKKIEINPGISQAQFDINNEIIGVTSADLSDVVSMLGEIGSDAKMLVKRLDTVASTASRLLGDENFVTEIRSTLKDASNITFMMNKLIADNMSGLQASMNNLKFLTSELKTAVQKNSPKIDSIITNIDFTISDSRIILNNTGKTISNADSLISDLRKMTEDLKTGKGFASRVLYDAEFSKKIDSTLSYLNLLIEQIRQNGINANIRLGGRP
jgi:phospholipid/cholesterol/gamma-HCH transport system substrate-binding protein